MKIRYISIQFHHDKKAPDVPNGCLFGNEINMAGQKRPSTKKVTKEKALDAIDALAKSAKRWVMNNAS